MKSIYEKIIYKNDRDNSVEITYSFPFFLQEFSGADGLDSIISKTKSTGQDGYSINSLTLRDRPLRIIGVIKADDKTEAARYRSKLLEVFNPHLEGTLQYEYGDIKKQIRCRVESAPKFQKKNTSFKRQLFSIELIAPNPYFKDLMEVKTEIAKWRPAFHFPLVVPAEGILMGFREPSLIVNIFNGGDVETGMRIRFKALGTLNNPSLFNVDTREYFKINKEMVAGEVIEVNTNFQRKKVTMIKQGVMSNAFNNIDLMSTFLQLDVGDNLFRYDAETNPEVLEVDIYYNPQFLGV